MKFCKALCIVLTFAVLLCLAACGKTGSESGQSGGSSDSGKTYTEICIPCDSADSFNPYTAKTELNRRISALIYEPLCVVDQNYKAINILANSATVNGRVCTVTLKDAIFSDGAAVTASDVLYSFNSAKQSKRSFAATLKYITATAVDSKTVVFTNKKKSDPLIMNLLTFPIIETGSDKFKNGDGVEIPPIGSGRFKFNADYTGLEYNAHWKGTPGNVKNISFVHAPDNEVLAHEIEIDAIDVYFTDLSDCNILRMGGTRYTVDLNNLVYIGINHKNSDLKKVAVRQAISAAIDRSKIAEEAYFTNAEPATGIFNPHAELTKSIQTIPTTANPQLTIEYLEELGYNNLDVAKVADNPVLSFNLLVNTENTFRVAAAEKIAAQLTAAGIKINLQKVKYSEYKIRLAAGNFDLYLAEVNVADNLDISEIVLWGGSSAYGIAYSKYNAKVLRGEKDDYETAAKTKKSTEKSTAATTNPEDDEQIAVASLGEAIFGYYNGTANITDIATMAITEMPVIPVCYRNGIIFATRGHKQNAVAYSTNIFNIID